MRRTAPSSSRRRATRRRRRCSPRCASGSRSEPGLYRGSRTNIKGVTEETTTGVHRLYQMEKDGRLPFPAINVNDSVTKSKFDNLYGCRESLVDGIKRATDVMVAGKVAVVAATATWARAAPRRCARLGGPGVDHRDRPDLRAPGRDGRLSASSRWTRPPTRPTSSSPRPATCNVITHEHMKRMKHNAIVCNIGHFDSEIDIAALKQYKWENIKPQVDHVIFPDGKRLIVLAEGPAREPGLRHGPSRASSCRAPSPTRCSRRSSSSRNSEPVREEGLRAAEAARREGGAPAPEEARRGADGADARRSASTCACRSKGRSSRITTDTKEEGGRRKAEGRRSVALLHPSSFILHP